MKLGGAGALRSEAAELKRRALDDDACDNDDHDGPSIVDLEAELDELQKKLNQEQASIDEARKLRANRRQLDGVLAHASKRGSQVDEEANFFITGITGDAGIVKDTKKKPSLRELYPNLEKEKKLQKEDALLQKMARLKGEVVASSSGARGDKRGGSRPPAALDARQPRKSAGGGATRLTGVGVLSKAPRGGLLRL